MYFCCFFSFSTLIWYNVGLIEGTCPSKIDYKDIFVEFLWKLSELRTPLLNKIMSFITRFGEETLILLLVCLIFWCMDKELGYRIGISYFTAGIFVQTAKVTFRVDRPWIIDSDFSAVPEALPHASGYSFPSGHTQSATSIYGCAALYFQKKWIKICCMLLILAVAFSRMYLGVHTPADVIAGFTVSFIFTYIINRRLNASAAAADLSLRKKRDLSLSIVMAVMALFCFIYPFILYKNGTIELNYASDCAKQAGAALAFAVGFFLERNYIHYSTKTTPGKKILIFIIGLIVTIALKSGLKPLFGISLAADTLRYFLTVFWITPVYPFIITRIRDRKSNKNR